MALSGTYTFDPTFAEIMDEAIERIGYDPSELSERHIKSAIRSGNLIFSEWANKKNPQWAIEQEVQVLTQGLVSYAMPAGAQIMSSMVMRSTTGSNTFDTEMYPISRGDYLRIADPTIQGRPTQYFVDKERTVPTIFLWNAPENSTDSIVYNYVRRLQDVGGLSNTADLPFRWFEAICCAMAARMYPKMYERIEGRYIRTTNNSCWPPNQLMTKLHIKMATNHQLE